MERGELLEETSGQLVDAAGFDLAEPFDDVAHELLAEDAANLVLLLPAAQHIGAAELRLGVAPHAVKFQWVVSRLRWDDEPRYLALLLKALAAFLFKEANVVAQGNLAGAR